MQEAEAKRDERDDGAPTPRSARDADLQAQRRELRAAAAAEAGYILSVLGR